MLPKVINFIPRGHCGFLPQRYFYRVVGKRAPKKGEFYLSGAIVEAYEALFDMADEYTIVEKAHRAKTITIEVPA
jgi:hypothetical protein